MKCAECGIDYPGDLVSLFNSSNGAAMLCGICALDYTNRVHGTRRTHFQGEIAESLRVRAIAFRRKKRK